MFLLVRLRLPFRPKAPDCGQTARPKSSKGSALIKGFYCVVAALLMGNALLANSKAVPPIAALTGFVTSDGEGPMEGVLVTAKLDRGNISVTVISDDQGRYVFPAGRLRPGKHTLAIRAVGYQLYGQSTANIEPNKAAHLDIKLVKV